MDHTEKPIFSIGLKRFLLDLNYDLDAIKSQIQMTSDYGFMYNHSHNPRTLSLSNVQRAILYMEDRRFFAHGGVEFRSIPRSVKRYAKVRRFGGISTIDQQVVRIVTKRNARSVGRKVREILLAFFLNFHVQKSKILYCYMHDAYFGYRLIGVEIAARRIFQTAAADLDFDQASFLACLLPLPLPKKAYDLCVNDEFEKNCSPDSLLSHPNLSGSKWARRISYRLRVCREGYDFRPSRRCIK